MSSRSPTRPDRAARAAAVLLAVAAVQLTAPVPARAAVDLPVAAVLSAGGQTSLVVDLGASTRKRPPTVTVTRDGVRQPAGIVPVIADGLGVTLVVDASADGAATLPAWLSAAARFILEAPDGVQAVVVTDTAPARAITPPQRGPVEVVRALDSVRAGGTRDTSAALAVASRQFPTAAVGQRVAVVYTTAPRAGQESAAAVAARFRAAGTILVVVGTGSADAYWADATATTGGFFAPAGNPVVVPALDQVQTTLRSRYLVRFPTPPTLPAHVSVRVDTGDLTLTADAAVDPPPVVVASPAARSVSHPVILVGIVAGVVLAGLAVAAGRLLRRGRRPRRRADPTRVRPVARGQATVPQTSAAARTSRASPASAASSPSTASPSSAAVPASAVSPPAAGSSASAVSPAPAGSSGSAEYPASAGASAAAGSPGLAGPASASDAQAGSVVSPVSGGSPASGDSRASAVPPPPPVARGRASIPRHDPDLPRPHPDPDLPRPR